MKINIRLNLKMQFLLSEAQYFQTVLQHMIRRGTFSCNIDFVSAREAIINYGSVDKKIISNSSEIGLSNRIS